MKNLKLFYKNQVKTISQIIKDQKKQLIATQKEESKGKSVTPPAWKLQMDRRPLREKARYLFMAYALVRGRDLSTVERNPDAHDSEKLKALMEKMEQESQLAASSVESQEGGV